METQKVKSSIENTKSTETRMFKAPFSFKGRIRRTEYWITHFIYSAYAMPMELMPEDDINPIFALIWLMLFIPFMWFYIAQGAKRCHDRGNSGWYQLIPFYGLWMAFGDGESHSNEYGPDPKGRIEQCIN